MKIKSKTSLLGMLCLINKLLKIKHILALVFVVMCAGTQSSIAQTPPLVKLNIPEGGLKIGDKIPEEIWNLPLTIVDSAGKKKTITLNDYRGKLILLDFWATWCSSCIEGFPKFDFLQKKYGDKLQVILVNPKQAKNTQEDIDRALENFYKKTGYEVNLPNIIRDTIFQKLFPYKALPHIIWISSDGKFAASTYASEVNSQNIENIFSKQYVNMHIKKDSLNYNPNNLLLTTYDITKNSKIKYRSILSEYIQGVGTSAGSLKEVNGSSLYRVLNYSLNYFYNQAFNSELSGLNFSQWMFSPLVDSSFIKLIHPFHSRKDKFCFELYLPGKLSSSHIKRILRQDLLRYFNVKVSRIRKEAEVWIVSSNVGFEKYYTKGEAREFYPQDAYFGYLKNTNHKLFFNLISLLSNTPIIDSTGIKKYVDINLPTGFYQYSKEDMLSFIEDLGLEVKRDKRMLDFAYFSPIGEEGKEINQ